MMEISINLEEFSLNSRVFFAKLKNFFAKLKEFFAKLKAFFAKLNFSAICGTQGGGKALKKQAWPNLQLDYKSKKSIDYYSHSE